MSLLDELMQNTNDIIDIVDNFKNYCTYGQTLIVPEGVETIGDNVFHGSSNITELILPNSLTSIGAYSFYYCTNISELNLPNSLTAIGEYGFARCQSITELILPDSLTSIGTYSLSDCANLATVFIPKSVTYFGRFVFFNCTILENVTIGNGFNCNGLNLSFSTLYSTDTIVSWLNALADRTGETAYTLTIGTTNLNKLTNEQKAIAINKNWNLA